MPIDIDRVLGAQLEESSSTWTQDDVILYHLALGAGVPPTDPSELSYVYEANLKVLPSYAVLPAMGALIAMLRLDGMDVDLAALLHAEQELELHEAVQPRGEVRTTGAVTGIYDKGKAALVLLETQSRAADDGRPLFTNRFSAFVRGEGGFGGDGGPPAGDGGPGHGPAIVLSVPTLPQQSLLYRLCGDRNPLHADPAFAARAGFDRPILHGLCSYGIVCKALVDATLDGDVGRVRRYRARFAGVLFPGETLEVSAWDEGERVLAAARCVERDAPVLSHVELEVRA